MARELLWMLHLAFSLLTAAAGLGLAARRNGAGARALVALPATLPLLALNGYLAWLALGLRFGHGVLHAPWQAATLVLGLHALFAALLARRALRGGSGASWPVGALALAAAVALALDLATFWNLELRARLQVAELSIEAGRITFREGPAAVSEADNAAPVYSRVGEELFGGEDHVNLRPWSQGTDGMPAIDPDDPELLAALGRCAAGLAEVRDASTRAHCRHEDLDRGDENWVTIPDVFPMLHLSTALQLEARVRAARGDLPGALEDLEAAFALGSHASETPVLSSTMVASVARSSAVSALAEVLSSDALEAAHLEGFAPRLEPALAALMPRVITMETAFGLGAAGLVADWEVGILFDGVIDGGGLRAALYKVFLLEEDVRGYRESMRESIELSKAPPSEVARAAADGERRLRLRRRGVLSMMMMSDPARYVLEAHRSDARLRLVPAALAAARLRLERGSYPTGPDELGSAGTGIGVEGDGASVRLTVLDVEGLGEPIEVTLTGG